MKKVTIDRTDKKFWELQKEANKKRVDVDTIASSRVTTYPKYR